MLTQKLATMMTMAELQEMIDWHELQIKKLKLQMNRINNELTVLEQKRQVVVV